MSDENSPRHLEDMKLRELTQLYTSVELETQELARQEKAGRARMSEISEEIIRKMESEGFDRTTIDGRTYSLNIDRKSDVTDWEAFLDFVYEERAGYLLQRRINNKPLVEYEQINGKPAPGIQMDDVVKLGVRKA